MDTDQLTFIVQISDDAIDDLKIIKKSGTPAIKTKNRKNHSRVTRNSNKRSRGS